MNDHYLTHYYTRDTPPFRSLSALPDCEALRIMESLYVPGAVLWDRFKEPAQYLRSRRATEGWVRDLFIAKGGRPAELYPVYMVLGTSPWVVSHADLATHAEIRISLSIFEESDVSFTYPDSMISYWFDQDKPAQYYRPDLHGKIFTRTEILAVVAAKGMPEECWETYLPDNLAPYIEAQVWNQKPLREFIRQMTPSSI